MHDCGKAACHRTFPSLENARKANCTRPCSQPTPLQTSDYLLTMDRDGDMKVEEDHKPDPREYDRERNREPYDRDERDQRGDRDRDDRRRDRSREKSEYRPVSSVIPRSCLSRSSQERPLGARGAREFL
jgi:hypothetical protein